MARRQLLKEINRSVILNVIKAHGPIARADIARLTQISPAAVTHQTAALIEDGLIFEKQEGNSRGGRRPILLALNATGTYVVGVKLAETRATLALTDLNAEIVTRHAIDLSSRDPVSVSDQLAEAISDVLNRTHIDHNRMLGVGVGMAGIIDSVNGICRMSPYNGWHNVPFADLLEERLDYPVILGNDVSTLTLVEKLYGPGQHVNDLLVVTLGRGVGLGMVLNGQMYRGARGSGGEFGHTTIDPQGVICQCGKRGCLETYIADPWLLRRAAMNGLTADTVDDLLASARGGDGVALHIYESAGQVLGQGIANLINLFNPSVIIVSGEGVRAGDFIFPAMRDAIAKHTFGQLGEDVVLRIEPASDDTWARGAAGLVLNEVFEAQPRILQLSS